MFEILERITIFCKKLPQSKESTVQERDAQINSNMLQNSGRLQYTPSALFEQSINQVKNVKSSILEEFISKPPCHLELTDINRDSMNAKQLLTLIYKGHKFPKMSFEELLYKIMSFETIEKLRVCFA